MRFTGILALILFLFAGLVNGQQAKPKIFKASLCGTVVLSDVEDKYNATVYSLEMPETDAPADVARLKEVKRQIALKYPHRQVIAGAKTTSAAQPVVGLNYIADTATGVPPDNYLAVGLGNKTVSVVNETIAVHDSITGAYLLRKGLMAFSNTVGLNNIFNDYRYDPKITYDPIADKYIIVMLNATNQENYIVMGFSKTNNPAGAWNFYKFYGDYTGDTTWFDYPAIAQTPNEFFLTGNKIKYDSSWQAGFTKSLIYQVRKQDGYNGDSVLTYQIWDSVTYNGNYLRCLYPVNPGDYVSGPSQYLLSNRDFEALNDTVFIIKIADTIGSGGGLTVVAAAASGLSYGVPPDARQPDTALTLATNDNRVLGGFIEGNEIQFVNTTVNPATGAAAIYHGVISNYASSPAITGRIFGIDTLDMGYPNISYAGNYGGVNQSIISFNYSGPHTYPAFGATFFDGSGYSAMLTIKGGDSTINALTQKEQRWGDYSGSQPQWGAPGIVWVEGIYGRANHQYGNYIAQLASPNFTGVADIQPKQPAKLYPNPAWEFVSLDFTMAAEQPVTFTICDMQGRVVDQLPALMCREGKNVVQFNIAPLTPGMYLLRGAGSKGEKIETHTFIRK